MLLRGQLVAEACRAAGTLSVAIEDKRVLPIDLAVKVSRLLKVVSNRQVTKNSLTPIGSSAYRVLHLLFVQTVGTKVAMVRLVAVGQGLNKLLIVRVVDSWVLLLNTICRCATNLVLDAVHADWLTYRRRTVLLLLVMLVLQFLFQSMLLC